MKIPMMIDSGAYSVYYRGEKIDIQDYIAWIKAMKERYPEEDLVYVNLDVIYNGAASFKNWEIMREAGLNPIPIYHVTTPPKFLLGYMKETDFVGLGSIAKMSTSERTWALDRVWNDHLIDKDRMPKCKVHGMGITSFSLMKRYPWYSLDSTSWLQAGMYGKVFLPRRRGGEWIFSESPTVLSFSEQSPSIKEKGKHFDNVSPHQKRLIKRYLDEMGFEEEGLRNRWEPRVFLNATFFARFINTLAWPRPFSLLPPRTMVESLGDDPVKDVPKAPTKKKKKKKREKDAPKSQMKGFFE